MIYDDRHGQQALAMHDISREVNVGFQGWKEAIIDSILFSCDLAASSLLYSPVELHIKRRV
jgi:hypothetical protein